MVRLPERDLSEAVLFLAAPLLQPLGPKPAHDDVHSAVGLAIDLWNAHVKASEFWGDPQPKPLAALRRKMCGKKVPTSQCETFELLCSMWDKEFFIDPRLVGEWSLEINDDGRVKLTCETTLPDGVEAEVEPPIEKRIAIGGQFLDKVRIRLSANTLLSFPLPKHRGEVSGDGNVTIYTKMPTAVSLFAEGVLQPVGGDPVELVVSGKKLFPMVLAEVRCSDYAGNHDTAILVFKPATAEFPS